MTTATGKKIKTDKGCIQYFNPDEIELARGLPDDMIAAFEATGNAQGQIRDALRRLCETHKGSTVV